ncbi:SpoIID/LytB domain-containing protein [Nocardia aurantiaca]|uniref:SpoIID/LytB domain-containing protein n=1 Tax=Nocardia aurantiaca TaxID=2675850 RepID=A0A6I3KUB1_9NOCA|nr:SpoIID/LytB domain-containing protein [Nocardia aurantiaca]MTE12025.1 SpoIID/LytB domain-containing protein [Nocardia aurantiaca]
MPNGYLAERRKRRGLLTLSLAVAATTGGTALLIWAWPDNAFLFTAGAGHGRGLSQNGAFDKAAAGWNADRILANYYDGAELAEVGPTTVRVRLMGQDDKTLDIGSDSVFYVAGRRVIPGQAAHLTPTATGADVTITQGCGGDTLWEGETDDPWAYPVTDGTARPANEQLEICGGNAYRGVLGVALDNGSPRTVNEVDLDDYLKGVVPAEMVPGWADQGGTEALRAQAIAARSYALAEERYPYAQTCDTTDCQMYLGTDKEDPRTTDAVEDTSGRVLVRDNHILRAEYSAAPDGGLPTPASAMEIGPALTDFPAAVTPGLPTIPVLTPPTPQTQPTPTESDPATPTTPDAATPDPSVPAYIDPTNATPGAETPATSGNSTPVHPAPENRTRVNIPLPTPGSADPNSMVADPRSAPAPAGSGLVKPVIPAETPAPRPASTPALPASPVPAYAPPQPTTPALAHQTPR